VTKSDVAAAFLDPLDLRAVFACVPQSVVALCGLDSRGQPIGLAASSFSSVSLEPALISVCMATTSLTWPRLRPLDRLGVSVLADNHDQACRALAGPPDGRFADIAWHADPDGSVLVDDSAAWMNCSLHAEIPAGDHNVVLLRVHHIDAAPEREPLVFHASRFRRLFDRIPD
jgi:flavin reductase (DIM6/NTAB) family NADH-FMN oxidoreductase RutF